MWELGGGEGLGEVGLELRGIGVAGGECGWVGGLQGG